MFNFYSEARTDCCDKPECFQKHETDGLSDVRKKEQVKRFIEILRKDGSGMAFVGHGANPVHNRKMEKLLLKDHLEPTGCIFRHPETDEMTLLENGAVRRLYKRQAFHLMFGSQPSDKPHDLIRHFSFEHLPEHLQEISRPICELAYLMDYMLEDSAEKTAGLRKLLEAKDCLVRSY